MIGRYSNAFCFALFNHSNPGMCTRCRSTGGRMEKRILDVSSVYHTATSLSHGHGLVPGPT